MVTKTATSALGRDCIVCGLPASEMDHFPSAARHGGDTTVPLCRGCHDAKDRLPLDTWNPAVAFSALSGLWEKADREERILIMKMTVLFEEAIVLTRELEAAQQEDADAGFAASMAVRST